MRIHIFNNYTITYKIEGYSLGNEIEGGVMKILIVDDSLIIQDRVSDMITEETNYEIVGHAYNTEEGKGLTKKLKPDVVISDIRMPGGGGMEFLKFINKNKISTKIIIITNYPYSQYRDKALELGADYFLSKSDDLERLVPVLNEINDFYHKKTSKKTE